jgi:two-component system, cell cycle response regulator DivK
VSGAAERPVILLVEDNETIRNAFSILLEESGYTVVCAGSGTEAVRVLDRGTPDLVLMDLGLPDVEGLELTRRLKARDDLRSTPVVALTGRALETDREACMAAGCAGYLVKPIDTEALLRELPGYLGR